MTAFIIIGAVGLAVVLLSLVVGDLLDGLFDAFDLEFGGGLFSTPVLGSFLAAFGFGAALIMSATGAGATVGAFGGLGSGAVVGGLALLMMRSLMDMSTDATPTTTSLEGATGLVITTIPVEGYGEVSVRHHGNQHKYNARSDAELRSGTRIVVTGVLSASAVLVAPEPAPGAGEPAS